MRCYWEHVERKFWEHDGDLMGNITPPSPKEKKKKN
jgi:hypothetical protein